MSLSVLPGSPNPFCLEKSFLDADIQVLISTPSFSSKVPSGEDLINILYLEAETLVKQDVSGPKEY